MQNSTSNSPPILACFVAIRNVLLAEYALENDNGIRLTVIEPVVERLTGLIPDNVDGDDPIQQSYSYEQFNFHYTADKDALKCICVASNNAGIRNAYLFLLDVSSRFKGEFDELFPSTSTTKKPELKRLQMQNKFGMTTLRERMEFWNESLSSSSSSSTTTTASPSISARRSMRIAKNNELKNSNNEITNTNTTTTMMMTENNSSAASSTTSSPANSFSGSGPSLRNSLDGNNELSIEKGQPLTEGWINKKGDDLLGLWKRRWFVLLERELKYFVDETKTVPKGAIALSSIRNIRGNGLTEFVIECSHRNYQLKTENAQLCRRWISTLNSYSNKRKQQLLEQSKQELPSVNPVMMQQGASSKRQSEISSFSQQQQQTESQQQQQFRQQKDKQPVPTVSKKEEEDDYIFTPPIHNN